MQVERSIDIRFLRIEDFYDLSDKSKLRSNGYIIDDKGKLWRNLGNICWFTNLDIQKRHEDLILYKSYSPEEYPTYDNYNAIEVKKVADIPCDYDGVMGVPITFMDKYNPVQFEVLGLSSYIGCDKLDFFHRVPDDIQNQLVGGNAWMPILHNKSGYQYSYRRIFIRKR